MTLLACLALSFSLATSAVPFQDLSVVPAAAKDETKVETDPSKAEVRLPSEHPDWYASLIVDNGETGIWTVEPLDVYSQYAVPEVVGCDDLGRLLVCISYSGKWTTQRIGADGKWFGGLACGDLDPRIEGNEVYVGGQNGNLYQVKGYRESVLDCRRIAHLPGLEIHTLVLGDFDASGAPELLAFTRPGNLYRLTPTAADGRFDLEHLQELPGRVRDALVLERPSLPPRIATVTRAGTLDLLEFREGLPQWTTIHRGEMGMGRIASRQTRAGETVLYAGLDDGRVIRWESKGDTWTEEVIYCGPQGNRGIAVGRFDPDPSRETVAVFGYSARVELLTRTREGWQVETLFVDRDKGHWLAAAELDGRNDTDELVASGYGGRIVMLSRTVGTGVSGAAVDPGAAAGGHR